VKLGEHVKSYLMILQLVTIIISIKGDTPSLEVLMKIKCHYIERLEVLL